MSGQEAVSVRQLVKEDWITCGRDWTRPGFRALAVYRVGHWLIGRRRLVKVPIFWLWRMTFRYVRNHYGMEISPRAKIGRRCRLVHQNGVTIHPRAIVGDDCIIEHLVTIGAANENRNRPVIGDRVALGVGAVIVGNLRIGDDVRVGPNTVVMTNVPDGASVFGNPARIVAATPRTDTIEANKP